MNSALKSLLIATTTTTLMASTSAVAYEQGDILVKGGIANVSPDDRTTSSTIAGAGAAVDSETAQVGLTMTYMYTDKVGVELLAATPFKHNISGTGGLAGVSVADTKQLPPTVTVNYYPLASSSQVQPYVGAGINYTNFFDVSSNLAGTNVELDDSWGLAIHAGVDYALDENWSLNAALWYIDIDTEATLTGGTNAKIGVEIDPMVYMVGVSYKF